MESVLQEDLIRVAVLGVCAFALVALLRGLLELITRGVEDVREKRNEGGGLIEDASGELVGGGRGPSAATGCGVHLQVANDGAIEYRLKSVLTRRP